MERFFDGDSESIIDYVGKEHGMISKYPKSNRVGSVVRTSDFSTMDNSKQGDFVTKDFFV
jgi:hypothetical protein